MQITARTQAYRDNWDATFGRKPVLTLSERDFDKFVDAEETDEPNQALKDAAERYYGHLDPAMDRFLCMNEQEWADKFQLHCYTNGTDTIVAHDQDHAWEVWQQYLEVDLQEDLKDYTKEDYYPLDQVPDDQPITIVEYDRDGPTETKRAVEWAALNGVGFLCTTEY